MQGPQIRIYLAETDNSEEFAAVSVYADGQILQDGPNELIDPILEKLERALVRRRKSRGVPTQERPHSRADFLAVI